MVVDKEYWKTRLPHPLSPDIYDVHVYLDYMLSGSTLLLGCTHSLIPMSDRQMDIDPWYEAKTVIKQDWRTNDVYYTNIIGDGVLNLDQELAKSIILMASKNCKRLIIRSFNQLLPEMRIANYFPTPQDLIITPGTTLNYGKYSFYIWEFKTHQADA